MYAYCLSDVVMLHALEGVAGVGGRRPRDFQCGELFAVVSEFEDETVEVTRENVFAHERVIHSVLGQATPLPFRFGTLVSAEQLEAYVAANLYALMNSIERVRGTLEMSVKIIWDTEEIRREAPGAKREDEGEPVEAVVLGEGAAYLAAKRREILGDQYLRGRAEELAAWLDERVGELARERHVQVRPAQSLVVRAAYLVERERLPDYQKRVKEIERERPRLRFLTSGPWPPYSFSNIKP